MCICIAASLNELFIGNELLGKLRKMRTLADDDDELGSAAGPSKGQTSQQPAWMRNLHERCREWLTQLPSVSFLMTIVRISLLILL